MNFLKWPLSFIIVPWFSLLSLEAVVSWVFVSSDLSLSVRSIHAWLAKVSIRERDLPLFHPFMNVTLHFIAFGYLLFILSHRSTRIFSSKPRPKTQRQALICSKIDAFWFLTGSVCWVWSLMGWYHLLVGFTAFCLFILLFVVSNKCLRWID